MTFPDPRVTDSGVPEVEQFTFEEQVEQHRERLEVEQPQDWYFTFGCGQTHRLTGEDLMGSYVVISGTFMGARDQMVAAFGTAWCDQYVDAERAGVHEFNLRRIEVPTPAVAAQPVTPAEERTGVSDRAAAALTDVAELRRETFRLWSAGTVGRHDGLARLDRIEAALRGGQS
jgi:hypothetical protein